MTAGFRDRNYSPWQMKVQQFSAREMLSSARVSPPLLGRETSFDHAFPIGGSALLAVDCEQLVFRGPSLGENERAHLQGVRKPSHQVRCRNGLVVSGAGDAVLSERDHFLGDWKTGLDLAFPIGWLAWLAASMVICLFSVYLSPL